VIAACRREAREAEVGLRDRIEALAGTVNVVSPAGGGTALFVRIPLEQG
jgi:hypothetical protein